MSLETPIARTKEKAPEQMLKEPTESMDDLFAFLAACGMLALELIKLARSKWVRKLANSQESKSMNRPAIRLGETA